MGIGFTGYVMWHTMISSRESVIYMVLVCSIVFFSFLFHNSPEMKYRPRPILCRKQRSNTSLYIEPKYKKNFNIKATEKRGMKKAYLRKTENWNFCPAVSTGKLRFPRLSCRLFFTLWFARDKSVVGKKLGSEKSVNTNLNRSGNDRWGTTVITTNEKAIGKRGKREFSTN